MRKLLPVFFALALSGAAFAQDEGPIPHPTVASRRYHEYRLVETEPSYGLAKIKKLIKKIKADQDDNTRLPDRAYRALTVEERFTYTMIHAEDFSQNCDMMPPIEEEQTKIFAYFPGGFGGEREWSQRQKDFFTNNRPKVVSLLRTEIRSHKRVGLNVKTAIMQIGASELIPDLAKSFNQDKKDNDILTLMMILMEEAKFMAFVDSASYKKLYSDEATSYKAYLAGNSANKQLIVERALAFYHSKFK